MLGDVLVGDPMLMAGDPWPSDIGDVVMLLRNERADLVREAVRLAQAPEREVLPPGPWLTTAEAAIYLRLGAGSTVRGLVSRGDLKPDGKAGKTFLFRRETLDAYVMRGSDSAKELRDGDQLPVREADQAPGRVAAAGRSVPRASRRASAGRQDLDPASAPSGDGNRERGRPGRVGF
jgi:excisionase family DNA binding protein